MQDTELSPSAVTHHDKYYKVFTECVDILASEEEYDNPNSLESKKIQAFNSAKACAVMSKSMTEKNVQMR